MPFKQRNEDITFAEDGSNKDTTTKFEDVFSPQTGSGVTHYSSHVTSSVQTAYSMTQTKVFKEISNRGLAVLIKRYDQISQLKSERSKL